MIQFDVVLLNIGGHGLAQIILTLLLGYQSIPGGFNAVFSVFGAYTPDYRCKVPPLDNPHVYPNFTESDILNLTTPYDEKAKSYKTCFRYGFNLSECTGYEDVSCVNKSYLPIKCDQGFYYDRSMFEETVVTEFDLVCDNSHWNTLSSSLYYAGMLFGSLFAGHVADAFGRRFCCRLLYIGVLGCTFGVAFARTLPLYITLRALIGGFAQGSALVSYVYIMEVVNVEWRIFFAAGSGTFFSFGYMILSGVAYYWNNWHEMMFVCGIMSVPFFIFLLILPESPRWLLIKGKEKEGRKVVERMARINRQVLSEETWQQAKKVGDESMAKKSLGRTYSYLDIVRPKRMRWITLNVAFNWCVNSFVYYGVTLNAGALAGDIFINNVLNGVLNVAATLMVIASINRVGRKFLLASTMLLAGVSLLICAVVNNYAEDNPTLVKVGVALAFVGKFGISASFSVVYPFTAELYPTVVRTNGVGMGSTTSRIGGILAPMIISLQKHIPWLPNALFGAFGIAAGLLSLLLPETKGRPMMETIEEAEEFYQNPNNTQYVDEQEPKYNRL